MKEKIKKNIPLIAYSMVSILFVLPSIIYYIKNKTVYRFEEWFKFFLNDSSREIQTLTYIAILIAITIIYIIIIKNRKKIFENIKSVLKYVAIIGMIYVFSIPFTCSDVFYYMGVGRIDGKYGQNPYYTTIKQFATEHQEKIEEFKKDTVLKQGYINDWADSTVVYGPAWQLICKGISILSLGNVDLGLLLFKIINLIIHLINCWLIYKITGKKLFAIIYGLNPFVLIEAIVCVHNDIFVVLFTLLAIYLMKKKKIAFGIISLGLATAIKYFSVLLLPFILIYYFRKENVGKRIVNCIKYGMIFIVTLILPYLLYIQDLSILNGMATQQGKIAKSIYVPIMQYLPDISVGELSSLLLKIFIIIYFFVCLVLLFKKEIKFKEIIQKYTVLLLVFLGVLITQFQPWYLMWLMPIFMFQRAKNMKILVAIGIIAEFANSVFLLNGEGYPNGTPFILVMYSLILIYTLVTKEDIQKIKTQLKIRGKQIG